VLAGGRPNSISGGQNAFAGVVNPANAVWVEDRIDIGAFVVHQRSFLDNRDNNPLFPKGKIDLTYKTRFLATTDLGINKHVRIMEYDCSFSLATYTTPGFVKLRTEEPFPIAGTTPIRFKNKTQVLSSVFSLKLNDAHSVGFSLDYFYLSYNREGFQRSDTPLRSVSPGHVTNNGTDHSQGLGLSFGWRWNISKSLTFGFAVIKESPVGQFKKYRGFEPYHAKNYIPLTMGAGFTYLFSKKIAGRLEVLWTHFGNLPNANNTILPDGSLNRNKRGSNQSPGPGLQDATIINMGMGYKVNTMLSIGAGYSHRIKLPRKSPYIISHSYSLQTIYHILSFGANFRYHPHEIFLSFSHGFKNRESGYMPIEIGGGKFISSKSNDSLSLAWGYLY
jgi:long-chain fatty acid transport protein